jgi:hypothetical protein
MIYKIPCPTKTNGIRLFKTGDHQLAIEYQRGEPHVGPMAYDSALGKSAHTVTFKPKRKAYGSDAIPPDTGIYRSKGAMKPRGSMNINDEDPDEGGGDEIVTKLMTYLNDKLTPEQLNAVAAIIGDISDDEEEGDTSGERRDYAQASDRGLRERQERQAALDADFNRMFPSASKLKLR